jgi:hypothetical protein
MKVKTWLAYELEFTSSKQYENPFEDVDIEAVFTLGSKTVTFPGFWDGGNTWRVRYSLPKEGVWNYTVTCTDKENASLTGKGEVECVKYDGDLAIYKHGFLKTKTHTRYFMYNDGTPFFYLGDTHWTMPKEEFDEPGDHADDIECASHFKYIVDRRVEQGFTVYQSEPIDAKFSLSAGLFEKDIEGFRDLDRRFKYIADKGLVHANAQLVFPNILVKFKRYDDIDYMKRLMRYWAARYAAYPCLWTLGQEVDNDFYYTRGDQTRFTMETNPYKYLAEELHKFDAHKQPLTAHMEYFSIYPPPGCECTSVSSSAFRKVKGHTWYAYQWSRSQQAPLDYVFAKDGWHNGQGKVCILYESSYEYLATKSFGARTKGYIAYLNGLYGYGYGAQDMWYYKPNYEMKHDSNDGLDTVTVEDKKIHWSKLVNNDTVKQLGYMRKFFEDIKWWKLIPRFDNPSYFLPEKEGFYSIATDERDTIVVQLFNIGYETGKLNWLENCEYTYQWFNPRTGEYSEKHTFWPDTYRMYQIEQKPDKFDWVFIAQKKK